MTTQPPARSLGVMIERTSNHGTPYVTVRPMIREGDADSPINCCWDRLDNTPAMNLAAEMLLRGFVSDMDGGFIMHDPAYCDIHSIEQHRAEAMVKGLKRVRAAIAKADAREPGDIYTAYCKALGATWAVVKVAGSGSRYSDCERRFVSIIAGKHTLRSEIAAAKAAWGDSHPGKGAHPGRAAA